MSSRKENIYNHGSNSKNIRPKELQKPRSGINLNTTFANVPGSRSVLKPDVSTIFVPAQPTMDYDLQCDIAYSNYIQAFLSQQYTLIQIKKYNLSINDQLSKYADILSKKQEIMDELKQELKENDIKNTVNEFLNTLESKLNNNLDELSLEIETGFDKVIHVLQLACNQLYLKRVKPLQSQTEYNNLQELLRKCDKVMLKILNATGDNQNYQDLSECLDCFQNLQKQLTSTKKSVKSLENDLNKLTLETVSDILFNNNKRNSEKDFILET